MPICAHVHTKVHFDSGTLACVCVLAREHARNRVNRLTRCAHASNAHAFELIDCIIFHLSSRQPRCRRASAFWLVKAGARARSRPWELAHKRLTIVGCVCVCARCNCVRFAADDATSVRATNNRAASSASAESDERVAHLRRAVCEPTTSARAIQIRFLCLRARCEAIHQTDKLAS